MTARIVTWAASGGAHAALAVWLWSAGSHFADVAGTGDDLFRVEQGVAIETVSRLGDGDLAVATIDAEPVEISAARPEIEETRAAEDIPVQEVLSSETGPVQEIADIEPAEQPRPEQSATLEQVAETKVEELQSSSHEQQAARASERSKYLGSLYKHLEGKKVRPRSRDTGTVKVQITLDRTGAILSRQVTASSGFPALDEAAQATVDRAAPFPVMPAGFGEETIVLSVPFRFTGR